MHIFERRLSFASCISNLIQSCFFHLRNVAKIKDSFFYLELLIYTLIFSHLLLSVTCISQSSIAPLQMVQNIAFVSSLAAIWRSPITAIIASVCWVQVTFRIHLNIKLLTYKALHWLALAYIRATDFLFLQVSFPFIFSHLCICMLEHVYLWLAFIQTVTHLVTLCFENYCTNKLLLLIFVALAWNKGESEAATVKNMLFTEASIQQSSIKYEKVRVKCFSFCLLKILTVVSDSISFFLFFCCILVQLSMLTKVKTDWGTATFLIECVMQWTRCQESASFMAAPSQTYDNAKTKTA